jgi:hypothetical protein
LKQDDGFFPIPGRSISKMAAREERWRSGKKDRGPGSQDTGPDRKMAVREAEKRAGKLKTAPGSQKIDPDGKHAGRER